MTLHVNQEPSAGSKRYKPEKGTDIKCKQIIENKTI